jgi:DNA repair photolyase
MGNIARVERKSAVLSPSSVACLAHMPTINLTAGCAHGCLYCYAQGYCSYPGRGNLRVYVNTVAKLRDELARRRKKPAAVCFSPSSDPFQPVHEVLDLAYDVLELLFRSGIGVILLTKGRIPLRHMDLLTAHAPLVRAQVGLITLDEQVLRVMEPHAAPASVRLQQMRGLIEAGVETRARLDPILPGLTDDPQMLHELCAALSDAGVKDVSASPLFLRPALARVLRTQAKRYGRLRRVLAAFTGGKWLRIRTGPSAVFALPAARRRQLFAWLTAIAQQYGIRVHVCACKNPDLADDSCVVATESSPAAAVAKQLVLFDALCPQ